MENSAILWVHVVCGAPYRFLFINVFNALTLQTTHQQWCPCVELLTTKVAYYLSETTHWLIQVYLEYCDPNGSVWSLIHQSVIFSFETK